jgi:hypothetical protein
MARSRKQDALLAMETFIAQARSGGRLLANDGTALCLGDVLTAAGLSWNHWRRYPEMRASLEAYAVEHNLLCSRQGRLAAEGDASPSQANDMVSAALLRDVQKRLSDSEKRCAELRAENAALRTKLARMPHVDALVAKGGRFAP